MKRWILVAFWLLLAVVSAYFFVVRYCLYRDCIEAAASSCLSPEGINLTEGGMLWGILALAFLLSAAWSGRKRR